MTEQTPEQKKQQKQRNLAIAGVLVFMVVMFFAVSLLKFQEALNGTG